MRIVSGFVPESAGSTQSPAAYEAEVMDSTRANTLPIPTSSAEQRKGIPNPRLAEMLRLLTLHRGSNEFQNAVGLRVGLMLSIPYGIKKTVGARAELLDESIEWPLYLLEKGGNATQPGLVVLEEFWTYEAILGVAYLAFTTTPEGSVQMHALNPAYTYRVPSPEGIDQYVYYSQASQKHVTYKASQVLAFTRPGSPEFKELVIPTTELETCIRTAMQANVGMLNKQNTQQDFAGVIKTDDDKQIFEGMSRRKRNAKRFLFLKPEEDFTAVNLVNKDGLEADILSKSSSLEDLYAYIGIPLAMREPSKFEPDQLKTAVASMILHKFIPLAVKFASLVTHLLCAPVPAAKNRAVVVQTAKIPQLAAYYVEMTRASVAELNSGKSTINEQREIGGYDPVVLPEEVKDLEWMLETPIPVIKQWAEIERGKAKQGPVEQGTGASESMMLPGSQGGRDRRTGGEAKLVDDTGKK